MTGERQPNPLGRRQKVETARGLGHFGTLGLEIALSIAFGFFGGKWLDDRFNTTPYLSLLGFVFGVAAAIKAVMRVHGEMKKVAEQEEREQGNPRPIYDVRDDEKKNDQITQSVDDESSDDASEDDANDDDKPKDEAGR